jgi:hypothetical protein
VDPAARFAYSTAGSEPSTPRAIGSAATRNSKESAMKKTLIVGVVATACYAAAPAHARPQQGVKCPDGYEADITNSNRKLVCKKVAQVPVQPICSPLVFSAKGIAVSGNITLDTRGEDKCLATVTGQTIEPQFTGLPPGATDVTVRRTRVDPNGTDTYLAQVTSFAFPQGGPVYVGDAKNGVACPAGYDGDQRFEGRGIRCDKLDGAPRLADCDGLHTGPVSIGWRLVVDQRGDEDRCVQTGSNQSDPTKPEGMPGAAFQADRARDDAGWVLDKRNGRDRWQRKVYAYPQAL